MDCKWIDPAELTDWRQIAIHNDVNYYYASSNPYFLPDPPNNTRRWWSFKKSSNEKLKLQKERRACNDGVVRCGHCIGSGPHKFNGLASLYSGGQKF